MVVVEVSSVEPRSSTRHFSKNLSIIERLCACLLYTSPSPRDS